jgi:hypothetical protein
VINYTWVDIWLVLDVFPFVFIPKNCANLPHILMRRGKWLFFQYCSCYFDIKCAPICIHDMWWYVISTCGWFFTSWSCFFIFMCWIYRIFWRHSLRLLFHVFLLTVDSNTWKLAVFYFYTCIMCHIIHYHVYGWWWLSFSVILHCILCVLRMYRHFGVFSWLRRLFFCISNGLPR